MSLAFGLITLLMGLVVVLWFARANPLVAAPLIAAYTARTSLALIDTLAFQLPGAGDGVGWDHIATYWARGGVDGVFDHIGAISSGGGGHILYIWLISLLYALFAPSRLMIQALNVIFGSLTVLVTWRIAEEVGESKERARTAAWICALVPSLVFFSSVLMREVAVSFPLTLCLLYLVRWYKQRKSSHLILALTMLLISMSFHSGGAAVLLFAGLWLIGSWCKALFSGNSRVLAKNTLALIVGLSVVIAVAASGFGLQKFNGLDSGDVDVLTEKQTGFAIGRTAYLEDLHANSPVDLLWQAPIRLVYFLLAPFPWMLHSPTDAFGFFDSVLFFFLVARTIKNRKSLGNNPGAVLVLGVFSAMAIVFAIGVSNYGTALRHRAKMLPLLIAASIAIPSASKRKRRAPENQRASLSTRALGLGTNRNS